jgi:hypothetical protein
MKAKLSPEASAVQDAIQRITEFCKEWDANCKILVNPANASAFTECHLGKAGAVLPNLFTQVS